MTSQFFPGNQEHAIGELDIEQANGPVAYGRDNTARFVDSGAELCARHVVVEEVEVLRGPW